MQNFSISKDKLSKDAAAGLMFIESCTELLCTVTGKGNPWKSGSDTVVLKEQATGKQHRMTAATFAKAAREHFQRLLVDKGNEIEFVVGVSFLLTVANRTIVLAEPKATVQTTTPATTGDF